MADIINMFPNLNVAQTLRYVADMVDEGYYRDNDCTLVIGTHIYHMGKTVSSHLSPDRALFNLTYGIHKLMSPLLEV